MVTRGKQNKCTFFLEGLLFLVSWWVLGENPVLGRIPDNLQTFVREESRQFGIFWTCLMTERLSLRSIIVLHTPLLENKIYSHHYFQSFKEAWSPYWTLWGNHSSDWILRFNFSPHRYLSQFFQQRHADSKLVWESLRFTIFTCPVTLEGESS